MNTINTAILNEDFDEALKLINANEDWSLNAFMQQQAYQKLISEEAFDVLKAFIDKDHISLDVFEYDTFDNTIFSILSKTKPSEKTLAFLDEILPQIENIEDDLAGFSWLAYTLKHKGNIEIIEKLIAAGCDVLWKDASDRNLLYYTDDITIIKFLIEQGVAINSKDKGGETALFKAVALNQTELTELYLNNGAETNIQNNKGETPYHGALHVHISPELFELLAQYEPPQLDLKNREGQTLFLQYIQTSQLSWDNEIKLLELLLEQGADMFQEELDAYGSPTTAAKLLSKKSYSLFEMVTKQANFSVNEKDNGGNTWLHYVCGEDLNFEQSKAQELYKKTKLLLKAGADAEALNDEDKSAIDLAQDDDLKAKVVALLLKHKK